jgi:hypothetical protein
MGVFRNAEIADFRIELRKPFFMPGERVHGRILLSTTAPLMCRGLRVNLEHKSCVHWHTGAQRAHGALCAQHAAAWLACGTPHAQRVRIAPARGPKHASCFTTRNRQRRRPARL